MRLRGNEKTVIALRVDDGLIAATRKAEVKKLIADLESEFKITAKEASYFLRLEIKVQQDGSIKICQEGYKRILEHFRMADCCPSLTPVIKESRKVDTSVNHEHRNDREMFSYRSAVGAMLYLSTDTRPDIAYTVGLVSINL